MRIYKEILIICNEKDLQIYKKILIPISKKHNIKFLFEIKKIQLVELQNV